MGDVTEYRHGPITTCVRSVIQIFRLGLQTREPSRLAQPVQPSGTMFAYSKQQPKDTMQCRLIIFAWTDILWSDRKPSYAG